MFSPEEILHEHGLVGAFDTMAMMHDEELAIIITDGDTPYMSSEYPINDDLMESIRDDLDSRDREKIAPRIENAQAGVTYLELQMSSQALAANLYHRFGVRRGDSVAVVCHGHAAAEVPTNGILLWYWAWIE